MRESFFLLSEKEVKKKRAPIVFRSKLKVLDGAVWMVSGSPLRRFTEDNAMKGVVVL